VVAELVPEGVVDLLEAVEVNQQQPDVVTAPDRGLQRQVQPVGEPDPVRQAGQAVVQRLVLVRSGLPLHPPLVADEHDGAQHQQTHAG
jgi:hypothetical protein